MTAGGRKDCLKPPEGNVCVDRNSIAIDGKGTDAAGGMTYNGDDFFGGKHFRFYAKELFEFTVINAAVAGSDNKDSTVIFLKCHGFGNAGRNNTSGKGGKVYGSARVGHFTYVLFSAKFFEICFYFFDRHS